MDGCGVRASRRHSRGTTSGIEAQIVLEHVFGDLAVARVFEIVEREVGSPRSSVCHGPSPARVMAVAARQGGRGRSRSTLPASFADSVRWKPPALLLGY